MGIFAEELKDELDKYNEILIWGTGKFGNEIFRWMCKTGIQQKVKNFLVTGEPLVREIEGISVISIDELKTVDEKCALLIAVLNNTFLMEIQAEITRRDYGNVIFLRDYYIMEYNISIKEERRLLREESFDKMLDYMAESYAYNHREKRIGYKSAKAYLKELAFERTCANDKQIVFVVGTIYVRTSRIAIALKKKGYAIKVIKICANTSQYAGENMLLENGIELVKSNSIAEVLYKALEEKPLVYYIDPPWLDSSLAMFMIYNKRKYGKIIFGEYDVQRLARYFTHPEYYYITEQYALENADGVVWRYDAKSYMEREFGYFYKGKSIQFYDYCDECSGERELEDDNKVKLCMLPSHIHNHLVRSEIDNNYTHDADLYEILELIGNREECVLDIYIWAYLEEDLEVCKRIESEYRNVRFYYRIPHSELINRMRGYDYGLYLFKEKKAPSYLDMSIYNFATKDAYYCATCNKYFDYLAAGLPIIASLPIYQIDYLNQFGVVVNMNVDNFDIEFLQKNKREYRSRVKEALPQLLIDNQIQRLVDFIEDVGRN